MEKVIDRNVLISAIAKWGRNVQVDKIQEEALELALVINQLKCPTKSSSEMIEKLYDEIADVKIMIAQAEILFDSDKIDERVAYKMKRLKMILDED